MPDQQAVFDLLLEPEWEVERFRRAWREQVLPALRPGVPVEVDLRLGEPLPVREALAQEIAGSLAAAGVTEARLRVLSAHRQGFHWLMEEMLPRLAAAGPLAEVRVAFARWPEELSPADEVLSAALGGIPVRFVPAEGAQPAIYELTALRTDGSAALSERFTPVVGARPYMPGFPELGLVYPPTGLLRVEQGGRPVAEAGIDTDAEALWSAFQAEILPRLAAWLAETPGTAWTLLTEVATSDAMFADLSDYTMTYLKQRALPDPGRGNVDLRTAAGAGGPRARIRLLPDTEPVTQP